MGNWKMNGSLLTIKTLCEALNGIADTSAHVDMAVCVPSPYLFYARTNLKGVCLGAQNVSHHDDGAYTGEISTSMLKDFDCQYVLAGHSERRALYAETNVEVALKAKKITDAGMTAVVCIGESLDQRLSGELEKILFEQIRVLFSYLSLKALANIVIAYEPVWAIGTGLAATANQIQDVHAFIRQTITKFNENLAKNVRIVYGGSLKPSNAAEILALDDVDGGLIGGASLSGKDFGEIINQAKRKTCLR
ncbi:triose-phosphate isomerase [Facilibium subflavum]|uniref:triose-phosphate isomerase n=1 Tax=Facilibium subflavum TaxID=2219058 RepID=UPI000E651264|nr:triose-phosphate isomerase [Facilibium subflavum]